MAWHRILAVISLLLATIVASFALHGSPSKEKRVLVNGVSSPEDLIRALKGMDRDELDALLKREIQALMAEPLDRVALQNILVLYDVAGKKAEVEAVALALAGYSHRSAAAQITAAQIEISKGAFVSAFNRLDGVLRAHPELYTQLFGLIILQIGDEKARAGLASVLAPGPVWRWMFMVELAKNDPAGTITYALLNAIRKVGGNIRNDEKSALIQKLVDNRRYDQAYFVWLDLLQQSELAKVRNVFDGGFELAPSGMLFGWNLSERKTARMTIEPRLGRPEDKVLKLDFLHDTTGGSYVFQYLRLSPGAFTVSFEVQVDNLESEKGLAWRISCVGNSKLLAQSSPILRVGPWETKQMSFEVPDEECDTQLLSLETPSTALLDKKISGVLMFDNVNIVSKGDLGSSENGQGTAN